MAKTTAPSTGKSKTPKPPANFDEVFARLRDILKPYEATCILVTDTQNGYVLNSPYSEKWKKEMMFASIQIKKNYVSFYLFPVYEFPELLSDLPATLNKRMQGKSCFNFKAVDDEVFAELAVLTKKCADHYRQSKA